MKRRYILAKRGEELIGDKFQKYFVSIENGKVISTYNEWSTVKVFDSLDESFDEIKHLLKKHDEVGWYALDFDRWNDKY